MPKKNTSMIKKSMNLMVMAIALFMISCEPTGNSGELSKKIHLRDSCQAVVDELGVRIKELNEEISELDTTTNKNKRETFVSTLKVDLNTFQHFFEVQGVVEAERNIMVTAEIPGLIKQINVEEGQTVSKGQTMVILDTEVMERNIEEINTAYELAGDIFKKQESLWNQKIGSEIQYLEAKNGKEALENKLKTLRTQLEKAYIAAPANGVIDEIFSKTGEMATPPFPVLRLVNLSRMYIKSDVSENYYSKVKKGDPVIVKFPSLDEETVAEIIQIGSYINPDNRTFKIKIALENPSGTFIPNLLAIIRIMDFQKDSVVAIPGSYILADSQGEEYVYIIEERVNSVRARKIFVETGPSYAGKTMIKKGLMGNEELITEGARIVSDKEMVTVINEDVY